MKQVTLYELSCKKTSKNAMAPRTPQKKSPKSCTKDRPTPKKATPQKVTPKKTPSKSTPLKTPKKTPYKQPPLVQRCVGGSDVFFLNFGSMAYFLSPIHDSIYDWICLCPDSSSRCRCLTVTRPSTTSFLHGVPENFLPASSSFYRRTLRH